MSLIKINDIEFEPVPGVKYKHDLPRLIADLQKGKFKDQGGERGVYRTLIANDLWFLVYFVLGVPIANHKWWVERCREVQKGPQDYIIDLWARGHGKSTVVTTALTIQKLIKNPEHTIGIFSYAQKASVPFVRSIKHVLEQSEFLKWCYPDIFYQDPQKEAPKWSEEGGLYVRRRSTVKEASVEPHSLTEGMPTGRHFNGRIYDDIVTHDICNSPDVMQKVCEAFDMSQSLSTEDGWHWIVGTHYSHLDPLMYIKGKTHPTTGKPLYETRVRTATEEGKRNGASLYFSEDKLATLRPNKYQFACQYLLNPTPQDDLKLDPELLIEVSEPHLPARLHKVMIVDPAGERKDRRQGDAWGIAVIGFDPILSDSGAIDAYVLDLVIDVMSHDEALDTVVRVYERNGRILKLGVEKVGMSSHEIHVANALKAKGKTITVQNKRLVPILSGGRNKEDRILQNLVWPLQNGKLKILNTIPKAYKERLKVEMTRFPHWHDDGLDTLSYGYELIRLMKFGKQTLDAEAEKKTSYKRFTFDALKNRSIEGWQIV